MKIKSVKFWNMIGVIVGIAIIVLGIVLACTPAETYSTTVGEKVTFGADYYTYQYEASRNAAGNAAAAANNLRELGEKLALYAGLFFVVAGVLVTLNYLKKFFLEENFDFEEDEDFNAEEFLNAICDEEELDFDEEEAVTEDAAQAAAEEAAEEIAEETAEESAEEAAEEN